VRFDEAGSRSFAITSVKGDDATNIKEKLDVNLESWHELTLVSRRNGLPLPDSELLGNIVDEE
jgi:hypothetical protein